LNPRNTVFSRYFSQRFLQSAHLYLVPAASVARWSRCMLYNLNIQDCNEFEQMPRRCGALVVRVRLPFGW